MNRQARRLSLVISGALLAAACAPTGVTSYAGREVAAPIKKMKAKTRADHEAVAAYYEREARALHEKARHYQQMADQDRWRGGAYRTFYVPRYDAFARKYQAAEEDNLKQAKLHRELGAQAKE